MNFFNSVMETKYGNNRKDEPQGERLRRSSPRGFGHVRDYDTLIY